MILRQSHDQQTSAPLRVGLDCKKAIRNLVVVACIVVLPVFITFLQCCNPVRDDVTSDVTELSARVRHAQHRVSADVISHHRLSQSDVNNTQSRDESSQTDRHIENGVDYTDMDNKILNHSDFSESETHAYLRRLRVLKSREPTTTHKPPRPLSDPVDCSLLFHSDQDEIQRVILKLKESHEMPSEEDIINMAGDCPRYIRQRGYETRVLSQLEEDFPLAYGIRMYDRPAQAEQLLRAIYRPNNVYCLYVDKKAPQSLHSAMEAIADCFPNVFIASKLKRYVYASFSPIEADLQCMRDAMATGVQWKYFLNLAGTEFPLKTNREIVEILTTLNGTNDIEQYTFPKHFYHRFGWRHLVVNDQLTDTNEVKEQFDGNVTIQKGCSYNSFSRPFVEWVLTDELAQRFINWTKDMDSPDEIVWASLNHLPQAPGGYQMMVTQVSKTFLSREVIWYSSSAYCHSSRKVRGICILSVGDLPWLKNRWELFANKFDINFDHYALDCLHEALTNRTLNPHPDTDVNWSGVYRAPHVRQVAPPERRHYAW